MTNYYEILGVNQNDSDEEIRKKYLKLALKYHPDKNPDNRKYDEKFKNINTAYETLRNPMERQKYNFSLRNKNFHSTNYNLDIPIEDLIGAFGAAGFAYFSRLHQQRNIQTEVYLSLEEVILGCEKVINIHYKDSKNQGKSDPCILNISKGIQNGKIVTIPRTSQRNPVDVKILYKKDKDYSVTNFDLNCYMNISFKDSILTPIITLTTPTKEKVYIKVDKPIKDKSITKIKNRGLPFSENSERKGDIIVHFSIIYPTFTEKQKKLIEDFF